MHGTLFGIGAAALVIAGAWLSPLAAGDRPALALLAVTVSLPLGAFVARAPHGLRDAGGVATAAIVAALVLATLTTGPELWVRPESWYAAAELWVRTASWCVSAALIGACVGSLVRGGGVVVTGGWLFLCGLPFFYDKLPWFTERFEAWALQGCPWIGFSNDALGGDPLRRSVIYFGQWTGLSDISAGSVLTASTLWLAALFAFASLLVASTFFDTQDETPTIQPAL